MIFLLTKIIEPLRLVALSCVLAANEVSTSLSWTPCDFYLSLVRHTVSHFQSNANQENIHFSTKYLFYNCGCFPRSIKTFQKYSHYNFDGCSVNPFTLEAEFVLWLLLNTLIHNLNRLFPYLNKFRIDLVFY